MEREVEINEYEEKRKDKTGQNKKEKRRVKIEGEK